VHQGRNHQHVRKPAPDTPRNGLGIAALVLGIIGLVLAWVPALAFVFGTPGVILGALGIRRARRGIAANSGMAKWGTTLSALAVVAGVISYLAWANVYFGDDDSSQSKAHPPAKDVYLGNCEVDDLAGVATATLAVKNYSSTTSDYTIAVEFAAGEVRVGEGAAFLNALRPGQVAVADAVGTVARAEVKLTCRVTEVERTAS
jgi:hypothetical protein